MEQPKPIQLEYRLTRINTNRFDIHADNLKDGDAEFRTDLQFAYSNNPHLVRCRMTINMLQQGSPLIESEVDCHFEINANSAKALRQGDNVVIPAAILIQFASLCYGTMRGIIHTKTEGMPINRFILPPMYFHEIINQDFIAKA